jgi:hypothetical protein|tara:strand:- start:179 stop:412 length:234 start_codon:yes stop_codon:yes gene_type:complete
MDIYTVETDYSSAPQDSLAVAIKWYDIHLAELNAGDHLVTYVRLVRKYYNSDNELVIKVLRCSRGLADTINAKRGIR